MPDATLTMGTAGVVQTQQKASNAHVQIVRDQAATGKTAPVSWSATSAGSASVIAASADRVALLIVSRATTEVWVRFDATIPTSTLHDWYLLPGDRWEVPDRFCRLAVSLAASANGGFVLLGQGTDA